MNLNWRNAMETKHTAVDKLERILQYLFEQRRQAGNDETKQSGLDEACDLIASLQKSAIARAEGK